MNWTRCLLIAVALCLSAALPVGAEEVVELWRGGGFSNPRSVSVNPADGSCWVADTDNDQVVQLSAGGTELWRGGGFLGPRSVSVNPTDGSCWVADADNSQVVHLSAGGAELWRGGGFWGARSVSVNPADGSCWVANSAYDQVVHLSSAGLELWRGTGFYWPLSVSANSTDGSCWVADADNNQVVHLSSAGLELWRGAGFAIPYSVSVNPADGSYWVADTYDHQVVHLSAAGAELWRGGGFDWPECVSVNPTDGSCWVADPGNDQDVHLSSAGLELWRGGGFFVPYSVSVDPTDSSCWVAYSLDNQVAHLGIAGAHFSATPWAGAAPLDVDFLDLSVSTPTGPISAWAWDFGDGGSSAEQNPSHQYPEVGTYTVTLTVDSASGSDTETKEHYVHVTFSDVAVDYWAMHQILACVDANIVKGYDDGLYHPELAVTRDQMAVYIARALVSPSGDAAIPDPEPPPSFSDVPSNHWAYKHIEYAVSQNVVKGYDDGTYQPDLVVDRGQMAVYIARAMVTPSGDAGIPDPVPPATFPDVADTFWAYKHIEYCVGQDVVKGYDDGLYHPANPVTRDQMAVYIARAFGLL